jgi:hypothetical protein
VTTAAMRTRIAAPASSASAGIRTESAWRRLARPTQIARGHSVSARATACAARPSPARRARTSAKVRQTARRPYPTACSAKMGTARAKRRSIARDATLPLTQPSSRSPRASRTRCGGSVRNAP